MGNLTCCYCQPPRGGHAGRYLCGPRCPECQRIYELHLAAEISPTREREAVEWIRRNARLFRRENAKAEVDA